MTPIAFAGIIAFVVILVVGTAIKCYTQKKVDDLDGFNGIINLDDVEEGEEDISEEFLNENPARKTAEKRETEQK